MFCRYKINYGSLEVLSSKGLSSELIDSLHVIVNKPFTSKGKLLQAILKHTDINADKAQIVIDSSDRLSSKRIIRYFKWKLGNVFISSDVQPGILDFILLQPVIFFFVFRIRQILLIAFNVVAYQRAVKCSKNENIEGFNHNKKQILDFNSEHRKRTECLIHALKNIKGLNKAKQEVISVGPRNEAEIMLLLYHGFKQARGLDLFSYSPLIDVMDMNNVKHPDNSFDIYYSAFVLAYSPDAKRTIAEAIRVLKDGGFLAIGWSTIIGNDIYNLTPNGGDIGGFEGMEDAIKSAGASIKHVYWKDFSERENMELFYGIYKISKSSDNVYLAVDKDLQ